MDRRFPARRLRRVAGVAIIAGLAFHIAHGQLGLGGHSLDSFTSNWVYDAIVMSGAVSCLMRSWLVAEGRLAWLLLGLGLASNGFGEIYYSLAFGDTGNPPIPSFDDVLYLLYYPAAYAGLVMMVRTRIRHLSGGMWLDGAIAAVTSAAVIAALAFEPILRSATHGSPAAVATTLAYPVGDLILLAIVLGTFGLSGWRPGPDWLLLGIGLVLGAVADTDYLYESATGTYVTGGILDSLWVAAATAMAFAAWQTPHPRVSNSADGRRLLLLPAVFAVAALSVLLYGGFHHVGGVGLGLAATASLLVALRAAWTFAENTRLLESVRQDAVTDALTGLGNRRAMVAELATVIAETTAPLTLAMFDLDGFKLYNDTFGHVAGDTLLSHFGRRLAAAIPPVTGRAFRLGGDEFCVLLRCDSTDADVHIAACTTALSAEGDGFAVTTSVGAVAIPAEAATATEALQLADGRLYGQKRGRLGSARQQTRTVLLSVLNERHPDLHEHLQHVGSLVVPVGRKLGMSGEALDELLRAAELHDIGKAAIPDIVLNKPGPLSDDEWRFMRRHTIVGERILTSAPALAPVARIVRSSHERWDGLGYPDGLAGEQIPIGARIVFVCDTFDAITTTRPYADARSTGEAIAELQRGAGTQFDPAVVAAFLQAWGERELDRGPVYTAELPS